MAVAEESAGVLRLSSDAHAHDDVAVVVELFRRRALVTGGFFVLRLDAHERRATFPAATKSTYTP